MKGVVIVGLAFILLVILLQSVAAFLCLLNEQNTIVGKCHPNGKSVQKCYGTNGIVATWKTVMLCKDGSTCSITTMPRLGGAITEVDCKCNPNSDKPIKCNGVTILVPTSPNYHPPETICCKIDQGCDVQGNLQEKGLLSVECISAPPNFFSVRITEIEGVGQVVGPLTSSGLVGNEDNGIGGCLKTPSFNSVGKDTCYSMVQKSQSITLTASIVTGDSAPPEGWGYKFGRWGGACSGTDQTCTLSDTDSDNTNDFKAVQAIFVKTECNDEIDNDGDGLTDYPNDHSCENRDDDDETNPKQCVDKIDNDVDGSKDDADPGCTAPYEDDNSEVDYKLNVVVTGFGSVTDSGTGDNIIDCTEEGGETCSRRNPAGAEVSLHASPIELFNQWGNGATSPIYQVTMNQDRDVSAEFCVDDDGDSVCDECPAGSPQLSPPVEKRCLINFWRIKLFCRNVENKILFSPTCIKDNCPPNPGNPNEDTYNPGQENMDSDGYGDLCGNCPDIVNNDQADADGDGMGDVCEPVGCNELDFNNIEDVMYTVTFNRIDISNNYPEFTSNTFSGTLDGIIGGRYYNTDVIYINGDTSRFYKVELSCQGDGKWVLHVPQNHYRPNRDGTDFAYEITLPCNPWDGANRYPSISLGKCGNHPCGQYTGTMDYWIAQPYGYYGVTCGFADYTITFS